MYQISSIHPWRFELPFLIEVEDTGLFFSGLVSLLKSFLIHDIVLRMFSVIYAIPILAEIRI